MPIPTDTPTPTPTDTPTATPTDTATETPTYRAHAYGLLRTILGMQRLDPVLEGSAETARWQPVELFKAEVPRRRARRHVPA